MLRIFLSPAKLMADETEGFSGELTQPLFLKEAEQIMRHLNKEKAEDLQKLMKISDDIAQLNVERNKAWSATTSESHLPAAMAFQGEVYRGLEADNLSANAKTYLKENLYILSGLYGLLRPNDAIMPYRLEMGCGFSFSSHKNLYNFWKEKLNTQINKEVGEGDWILNLASNEYFKALNPKKLKAKVLDVEFLNFSKGEYRKIMVYFKKARGAMARFCAENEVQTPEELKAFNLMSYAFNPEKSSEDKFVFTAD